MKYEEAMKLLSVLTEKNTPAKPTEQSRSGFTKVGKCPKCRRHVNTVSDQKVCRHCLQYLDWSDYCDDY